MQHSFSHGGEQLMKVQTWALREFFLFLIVTVISSYFIFFITLTTIWNKINHLFVYLSSVLFTRIETLWGLEPWLCCATVQPPLPETLVPEQPPVNAEWVNNNVWRHQSVTKSAKLIIFSEGYGFTEAAKRFPLQPTAGGFEWAKWKGCFSGQGDQGDHVLTSVAIYQTVCLHTHGVCFCSLLSI